VTVLRHLLSILILPFTVTVVVPLWLASAWDVRLAIDATPLALAMRLGGVVVLGLGLVLAASSIRWFARAGRGTLAPWDPPRLLVVAGPYRYVRHPMIAGVVFILAGEAIALRSLPHAAWALGFLLLNLVYLPLVEEPMLRRRFGAAYDEYRRHVPAIVPRAYPWRPEAP
jgi:protein-S-isoprenylcysteine O-methyltransferase Ste14